MLTSRSEYRLLLRQDNATTRLSERAYDIGLLSNDDIARIRDKHDAVHQQLKSWKKTSTNAEQITQFNLRHKIPLAELIKRPEVTINDVYQKTADHDAYEAAQRALVVIKYEGYIAKQQETINKIKKFDSKRIPETIDFSKVLGLRNESVQRLTQYRPKTFFDASKIAGVNPADLVVLMVYLENYHKKVLQ